MSLFFIWKSFALTEARNQDPRAQHSDIQNLVLHHSAIHASLFHSFGWESECVLKCASSNERKSKTCQVYVL